VHSADIDGDGDMDVLGAASEADDVVWWENDGTPENGGWIKHTIDSNFNGACSVYSEDINNDGKIDVLGAALYADDIVWWENLVP